MVRGTPAQHGQLRMAARRRRRRRARDADPRPIRRPGPRTSLAAPGADAADHSHVRTDRATCNGRRVQFEQLPIAAAYLRMHTDRMLDVHAVKTEDLRALSPAELGELAARMLAQLTDQSRHLDEQSRHIAEQSKRIDKQAQAIKWRDAKIESITFQLARLKAWKFGAKTERMNAEQREIFEETLAADQADLEAQLAALQQPAAAGGSAPQKQQ